LVSLDRGDVTAARARIEESLTLRHAEGNTFNIAWLLATLGNIAARHDGNYAAGLALYEESIALFRAIGARDGLAAALAYSGYSALTQGDIALARARTQECLALRRALGNTQGIADALGMLATVALAEGDTAAARARGEESLAMHRASNDKHGIGWTLGFVLGAVALDEGDTATARTLYEESLALHRAIGDKWCSSEHTVLLGLVARAEGQLDQAEALFSEGLAQFHALGVKLNAATGLAALAVAAADRATGARTVSFAQRAARLGGATAALLEALGAPLDRRFRKPYEHAMANALAVLGEEAFNTAWQDGKQMTLDDAVAFALAPDASTF
jgi:tetratricopeptide (TPR) repeat protein